MDRRTLIAVMLSLGVYYFWYAYFGPPPPPPEPEAAIEAAESPPQAVAAPTPVPERPVAVAAPIREIPFEACGATGTWSTDGGVLRDLILADQEAPYEVTPLYSWVFGLFTGTSERPWKPYGEQPGPARILGERADVFGASVGRLGAPHVRYTVLEESEGRLVLQGQQGDVEITTTAHTRQEGSFCLIDVDIQWRNTGTGPVVDPLWVSMHDVFDTDAAGGMLSVYQNVRYPDAMIDGSVQAWSNFTKISEEPELYPGPVSWFGFNDRYFGALAMPAEGSTGQVFFSRYDLPEEGTSFGQHFAVDRTLAPTEAHTERFELYVGSLDRSILGEIHEDLKAVVQYGWFSFFAIPLLAFLKMFHAGLGNWGLAIVALTITAKIVFFPLTQSAFKSSQAMSSLSPKMQELREKLADNPEELNRKMVELFREHGVNPLGGCLPMILQMPVWFALFRVLLNSSELYHTEFLYLKDLSSVDPYCILPAMVMGLMLLQQQFTPTGNMDPSQARMMKLMPMFFGIFFFSAPAGLVVYFFVNTLLSIAQQWFIRRTFKLPSEEPAASVAK